MNIIGRHFKISIIVGWMAFLQLLSAFISYGNSDSYFTYQHEDYIFIMTFMTYFIVKAIENITVIDIKTESIKVTKNELGEDEAEANESTD